MTVFDGIYPLGLGTNRFPVRGADDEAGIEEAVELVVSALDAGVNFVDVTHTYSRGMAMEVLRRAFLRTEKRPGLTLKTRLDIDKTADSVLRRAEQCLKSMGVTKAKYFYVWSLFSLDEFHKIMAPGGLYEGARRLKDEGIVEHICCSTHARPEDMVKLIQSGAFEALTISYSLTNATRLDEVLKAAAEYRVGLAAMNPLGGGIIPRNADFFSFARNTEDRSSAEAALRFVLARPEIQLVLSGVSSRTELEENIRSVEERSSEPDADRVQRVVASIRKLDHFCTGCRYCGGCPVGIPVSDIMQCRNNLLFKADDTTYQAKTPETLENIHLLSKLECDFSVLFETPVNPCIHCGKCEKACTQRLNIVEAIADTYRRAGESGFSVAARKERLDQILNHKRYRKVGFYPGGIYTQTVLKAYRDFFGDPPFQLVLFDGNPAVWGTMDDGIPICAPSDILEELPDCIVITSYKFKEEIFDSISHFEDHGIHIVKLHGDQDIPWLF
ncbi:MAG: aldo/keto reductase [Acidaminococcaceae bacterium]|nr:aldo/keto reductase [Acidaminococcaceae bacterium]